MDVARDDLSRISVDTLQDWKRIRSNYIATLISKLDEKISAEDQTQRDALLAHVSKFVELVFGIVRPNLRVNGRNYEEFGEDEDDVTEHFDEALNGKIWSLMEERLKWDKAIATQRRTKPVETASLLQDLLNQHDDLISGASSDNVDDSKAAETNNDDFRDTESAAFSLMSLSAQLQQSISLLRERADRFKPVLAEVKALK